MTRLLDTVLLLALPASGKSEVRRYLAQLDPHQAREDFHMGPTVQLDDYPYVHLMRRVSQELRGLGHDGIFFDSDDLPMKEGRDWGTLIELVNEDYEDLHRRPPLRFDSAAAWLLDRYDRARAKVGADPAFGKLEPSLRESLLEGIEQDARQLLDDKRAGIPGSLDGRTIVIEFARGGPDGSPLPLPAPYGYQYSLSCLSDHILRRASILYVWVTPEESRRKNEERARPGKEGDASILHHGVPIAVMLGDYGTDDMMYLVHGSDRPDTVRVEKGGLLYHLPTAAFDNRGDLTSFLRADESEWAREDVRAIHEGLRKALDRLVGTSRD